MSLQPTILFEDNHLLAVQKPFGMLSQGDLSGDTSVVDWAQAYLKQRYQKPGNVFLALLHRIDRPVGGVLLLAKTGKAAARLSAQFQARSLQKQYLAVVLQPPALKTGIRQDYLAKLPGKNIVRAYDKPAFGAQQAILEYKELAQAAGLALLEVMPITGRQHQIRVQLARMGCGIVGDAKYANTDFLPDRSIALLAWRLTVQHPITGLPLTLQAHYPSTAPWFSFAAPKAEPF